MFNAVAGFYMLWQLKQREQSLDKNDGEGVVESKKILRCIIPLKTVGSLLTRSQGTQYDKPATYLRSL